jgi:hypothetical protein
MVVLPVEVLPAQASLAGTVREDSTARPLADAEVTIEALGRATRTDDAGRFLFTDLPSGLRLLRTRHVGHKPLAVMVQLVAGATRETDISLERVVVRLDSVLVIARGRRLQDFEDNRRMGLGHFFTRDELEKQHIQSVANALDQLPALRVNRGRGNFAWIASSRSSASGTITSGDAGDRRLGAKPACYAQVYLDNALVYHGRPDEPLFNVNSISVDMIEGIEYYAGAMQTPVKYSSRSAGCGVLVIWTRRGP